MTTSARYDFFGDRFDRSGLQEASVGSVWFRDEPRSTTEPNPLQAKTLASVHNLTVSRRRLTNHPILVGSSLVKAASAAVIAAFTLPIVLGLGTPPAEAGVVDGNGNGNSINTGTGGTVGTSDESSGGSSSDPDSNYTCPGCTARTSDGLWYDSSARTGNPGSRFTDGGGEINNQVDINCGCLNIVVGDQPDDEQSLGGGQPTGLPENWQPGDPAPNTDPATPLPPAETELEDCPACGESDPSTSPRKKKRILKLR